jgi:hypothetical protein
MKAIFSILIFLSIHSLGQTPNFQWASSAGGTSWDIGRSVVTDGSGNNFVTGYFQSQTITFGTITLTNSDNTGNTQDIFVVKHDPTGNVIWANSYGGTGDDISICVAVDFLGNVLITGWFDSSAIVFGSVSLSNSGGSNFFVTKLDNSGNIIWAKSASGAIEANGTSVATDAWGNVFVTGAFISPSLTIGSTILTNSGSVDMFLAKYDFSGNVLWAKCAGNSLADFAGNVATDNSGNVFISGYFYSANLTLGPTTLNCTGVNDIFIAKFDSLGNVIWAKSAGGNFSDWAQGMSTDAFGNVIITGYFESANITFDTIILNGNNDIFVAKYDSYGNILWANGISGASVDHGQSVTTDVLGNVLITGDFTSNILFFGSNFLLNPNTNSILIAKYDSSGNFLWAKAIAGCNCGISSLGICSDISGNAIITGYFHSTTVAFDSFTLTNADNSSATSDVFIAKLGNITGINENNTSVDLVNIYPNPSNGKINISSSIFIDEIQISDITGRIVYKKLLKDKNYSFQLCLSGVYLITLTIDNHKINKMLIVDNQN